MTHQFFWHQYYLTRDAKGECCHTCDEFCCEPCTDIYPCDEEPPSSCGETGCNGNPDMNCSPEYEGYGYYGPIVISGAAEWAYHGYQDLTCALTAKWVPDSQWPNEAMFIETTPNTDECVPDCVESKCGFNSQQIRMDCDGPVYPPLSCPSENCPCLEDRCRSNLTSLVGSAWCLLNQVDQNTTFIADPTKDRVTNPATSTFSVNLYMQRMHDWSTENPCLRPAFMCPIDYYCPSTVLKGASPGGNYACCGQSDDDEFSNFHFPLVHFGCWSDGDEASTCLDVNFAASGCPACSTRPCCGFSPELNEGDQYCVIGAGPGVWPTASYADSDYSYPCACNSGCSALDQAIAQGAAESCGAGPGMPGQAGRGWRVSSIYRGVNDQLNKIVTYSKIATIGSAGADFGCHTGGSGGDWVIVGWAGAWRTTPNTYGCNWTNYPISAIVGPNSFSIPYACDADGWTYVNPPPNPPPPTICDDQFP